MQYKIINNFLSNQDSDLILKITSSSSFCWNYSGSVGEAEDNKEFYFVHVFADKFAGVSFSFNDNIILYPIYKRMNLDIASTIRCKANLFCRASSNIKHGLHKDIINKDNTLNAIYYINTNNGYTEFEDGTIVDSEKNSLLLFNNSLLHRSVNQTDEKIRLNININFDIDYNLYLNNFQ